MTGLALIQDALKAIGVLGAGETAQPEDTADGLSRLNSLIDSLGTQRQTMYKVLRTTQTLTANTASYTIGSGGAISIVRPTIIERAGLIIDTTATTPVEIAISIYTDQAYARDVLKTLTSPLAGGIYYDNGWTAGLGIIYPLPIPTVSTTQLVLYTPQAVTEFADLVTDYTFPPGYQRFLRTNLALEIAPEYGRMPSPLLIEQAADAKADMKRLNHRLVEMAMPAGITGWGGVFNIYSGENDGGIP